MNKYEGHTPGPWVLTEPDSAETSISTTSGKMVVGGEYDGVMVPFGCYDNALANARLIADAPKLLIQRDRLKEALEALYDVQNGPPLLKYEAEWEAAMEKTYAALQEVDGDTP